MAKSRRAQRRERRTYKQWRKKELLKKLRRTENEILGTPTYTSRRPKVEWEVRPPPGPGERVEQVVAVDFSRGGDEVDAVMAVANADGTLTLFPRRVGRYDVVMKVNR